MKAYVRLLDEGTDVWREVEVEAVEPDRYRILGSEPDDEIWECGPGDMVRLVPAELSLGPVLVAVRLTDLDYYPNFLNGLVGLIDSAEMSGYGPEGLALLREAEEFFRSDYRTRRHARDEAEGKAE